MIVRSLHADDVDESFACYHVVRMDDVMDVLDCMFEVARPRRFHYAVKLDNLAVLVGVEYLALHMSSDPFLATNQS